MGASREDVERAFRARVRALRCPSCGAEFTDAALDWGAAWHEGRRDLMAERGWQERDGPYKLRCEGCGRRAWLNFFAWSVRSAEE